MNQVQDPLALAFRNALQGQLPERRVAVCSSCGRSLRWCRVVGACSYRRAALNRYLASAGLLVCLCVVVLASTFK